ncbi:MULTISPECIES: hypothetical protein [unclassified Microbacterium]|uniref:hypothetical protein n=1 Tax=unclassified Microbacterium TaxID=2609290 RepID=UPI000EA974DD|nr:MULTISPECIES: hypothetical protein [unclassified Microbacterium]MBT2485626.1 hypothetical protein [Microbacterium sp. ISL-108]RKN68404.1 hypothetical protein D7252_12970 [Microbacterium sp. CGR2]
MRRDPGTWDLDEMIASGQIEGDAVAAQRRLDKARLERDFFYALQHDVELVIEIAEASGKAAAKEERREAARAAKAQDAALGALRRT